MCAAPQACGAPVVIVVRLVSATRPYPERTTIAAAGPRRRPATKASGSCLDGVGAFGGPRSGVAGSDDAGLVGPHDRLHAVPQPELGQDARCLLYTSPSPR